MAIHHLTSIVSASRNLLVWLCGICWLTGHGLFGQVTFYGGVGYHGYRSLNHPVNRVIRAYNTARPGLIRPLEELQHFSGPAFSLGTGTDRFTINVDVAQVQAQSTAIFGGPDAIRTGLRLQGYQGSLAFGAFPGPDDGLTMGFGLSLVYARFQATITGTEPALQPVAGSVADEYRYLGIAPAIQLFLSLSEHVTLYGKPYYLIDLYDNEYFSLHKAINPLTFTTAESDNFTGRTNQWGVQLSLLWVFHTGK